MYGAYAWLTNSRPPVHTAERLLLLVGMAGFMVVGLAIPAGFASYGVVLGLGYLVVVVAAALAALATTGAGIAAGLAVQLVLVAAVLIAPLVAEGRRGGGEPAPADAAG